MNGSLVIIPTYNERENVVRMLETVMALAFPFEVLVVDDGSPDGTAALVKETQSLHPQRIHLLERKGKLGLGTAYIAGFRWGLEHGYDFIFEMDCEVEPVPGQVNALTPNEELAKQIAVKVLEEFKQGNQRQVVKT